MKKNISLLLLQATALVGVLSVASWWKLSYVLGSTTAYFSAINIVAPLAGAVGLTSVSALFFALKALFAHSAVSLGSIALLGLHVPTIAASLYWSCNHGMYRVGLPLLCMAVFLMHPAGSAAAFYALWALVPVAAFFLARNSIVATALGSTFTAHAVGTVVWLFITPLSPELYAQLMPIVLVERLVYASGMTLVYYATAYLYANIASMVFITKKA